MTILKGYAKLQTVKAYHQLFAQYETASEDKKEKIVPQLNEMLRALGLDVKDPNEIDISALKSDLTAYFNEESDTPLKAARAYFRDQLQGKFVMTEIGKVFLTGGSWKEMKSGMKKNEIKAKIIPLVPQILKGHYDGVQKRKKARSDYFVQFHAFSNTVKVDNYSVFARVTVGETENGEYEYTAYSLHPEKIPVSATQVRSPDTNRDSQTLDSCDSAKVQGNFKGSEIPTNATVGRSHDTNGDFEALEAIPVVSSHGSDKGEVVTDYANNLLALDDIVNNEDGLNIEILSITDLNGNPISLEELEDKPQNVQSNKEALFNYNDDNATASKRTKANYEALDIVNKIQSGELALENLTAEQKITLSGYSGWGGGLKRPDGTKGSPYEYYTPKEVAQGMWDLLSEMGFKGGVVLDPCAGTGIFSATAPDNAMIQSIELDETSGTINKAIFSGDENKSVQISPFEAVAKNSEDESVDAVITNVPFGDNRGGNQLKDDRYQNMNLEGYFILRSLDKLRPNGLAVFMSGTGIMSGVSTKATEIRRLASLKAEFMGAYRLPNKLFEKAGADVVTDVLVFKKHSRNNRTLIDELSQTNPEKLAEANVLWQPFISGKYFKQEGIRNVLGEQQTGTGKYGDVVRVINDDSIGNIAKLLRRFGGSRIDWELLESVEEDPIQYQDGDQVYFAGVLKTMQNGVWVNADVGNLADPLQTVKQTFADYNSALDVVESKRSLQVLADNLTLIKTHNLMVADMPKYLEDYQNATKDKSAVSLDELSLAITTFAYDEANEKHAHQDNMDYLTTYPELSDQIKRAVVSKAKMPEWFAIAGIQTTFKRMKAKKSVFDPKANSFTDFWRGQRAEMKGVALDELTDTQKYERLLYEQGANFGLNGGIAKAKFAEMFPHIDLDDTDDWCVSLDGNNVIAASDYYHGKYQEFEQAHNVALAECKDVALRARLMKQFKNAENRVIKADMSKFQFDITSPFVPLEYKLRFLQDNFKGDGNYQIEPDSKGKPRIIYKGGSKYDKDNEAVRRRLANYVTTRSFTTGANNEEDNERRLPILKTMIKSANVKFNVWVSENQNLMHDIEQRVNDKSALVFRQTENGDPINVQGINPDFKPRPHQAAYIRQQARHMGGICGFDVGLGKTSVALVAVQHLQSIGAKKKTIFCVPNTTLTNWRKEAAFIYTSEVFARCLFVGVRQGKDEKLSVKTDAVKDDILAILENKHDKIFMTMEAFTAIMLRDETLEEYVKYLGTADPRLSPLSDSAAELERVKSRIAELKKELGKSMKADTDYLEKMGIDSLVIDEAHNFKNAKASSGFSSRVKFLSLANPSGRGSNAVIKTWYIRGGNAKNDGVLCLTATPITNSPLEIYSMLCLSIGDEQVNKLSGCWGADQFLESFCDIEQRDEMTVDNRMKEQEVFAGLKNLDVLRKLISSVMTMKSASDLPNSSNYIPESEEMAENVALTKPTINKINDLKEIYQQAKEASSKDGVDLDRYPAVLEATIKQGEDVEVLAHPFNFINKISKLLLDEDLAQEKTSYFIAKKDQALAEKVIAQFNKLELTEERVNLIGVKGEYNLGSRLGKEDKDEAKRIYTVAICAEFDGDKEIILNTTDFTNQTKFLKLAEKAGLELDVKISAKMTALLENINKERANPQAKGGLCKQIIFCDMLGAHNKLKLMLAKKAKIPADKIVIFNAEAVKDQAEVQDIQDGFNAEENENRYQIIIANKKAEVGINLQKGTQAIHHLTVGWTPDSLQQRNGRGVRQGNYLAEKGIPVHIYHYDADGTFDSYKRHLVNKKADWIDSLLKGDSDHVEIAQGLTLKQQELLADAVGNAELTQQLTEKFAQENAANALNAQRERFNEMLEQLAVLKGGVNEISSFGGFVKREAKNINPAVKNAYDALAKYNTAKSKVDDLTAEIDRLKAEKGDNKANIATKQKRLAESKLKADRAWGVYVKLWETLKNQRSPLIKALNLPEEPITDLGEINKFIIDDAINNDRYYGTYVSNIFNNEGQYPELVESWTMEKELKEKSVEKMQSDLITQGERANLTSERVALAQKDDAVFVNGIPVDKGDFIVREQQVYFVTTAHSKRTIVVYHLSQDVTKLDDINTPSKTYSSRMDVQSLGKNAVVIGSESGEAERLYQTMAKVDESQFALAKSERSFWKDTYSAVAKYIDSSIKIDVKLCYVGGNYVRYYKGGVFNKLIDPELFDILKKFVQAYPEKYEEAFNFITNEYESLGIEYRDDEVFAPSTLELEHINKTARFDLDDIEKLNEELERQKNAIVVKGDEFGEFDVKTEEGKSALREKAIEYLKSLKDSGETVFCPALNAEVGFNRESWSKFKKLSGDVKKLYLATKIKDVIKSGKLIQSGKESYDPTEKQRGITYSVLETNVLIQGEEYIAKTTVRKLQDGKYQYDLQVSDKSELIVDSVEMKNLVGGSANKSDFPQGLQERNALVGNNTTSIFDDVQDGYVLNLFLYDKNGNPIPDDEDENNAESSAMLSQKGEFVALTGELIEDFHNKENLNQLILIGVRAASLDATKTFGYLGEGKKYGALRKSFFAQFSPSDFAKLPERSWILNVEAWEALKAQRSELLKEYGITAQAL